MKLQDLFEQSLNEISMSPSSLYAFANSPQAKGILVGFEAELVVPIPGGISDDGDLEHDYSRDEKCYDINQIVEFFSQGDHGLTRREADKLQQVMADEYSDWLGEQVYLTYNDVKQEQIQRLAQADGMSQQEIDQMLDQESSSEYFRYAESVEDDVREDIYDTHSEYDWLKSQGYNRMINIESNFDVRWPFLTEGGNPEAIDDIASSVEDALGITVITSQAYHGAHRTANKWILEPDSSIVTPDDRKYGGLELVTPSPPFPVSQALGWIDLVFDWARNYGCHTNTSTGFHMSVSLPSQTTQNLDWIKLVLFLGDQHVLEIFGRQANTYTASALKILDTHVRDNPNFPVEQALGSLRKGLGNLASQVMGKPHTDKYTSVNMKNKYVEFRSAGGNYLENQQAIKTTLLRYVRAIAIAGDPQAEKQEYATKLYKLLKNSGSDASAPVDLFSQFSSGMIGLPELKQKLQQLRKKE
jgi:hypothetical protein